MILSLNVNKKVHALGKDCPKRGLFLMKILEKYSRWSYN